MHAFEPVARVYAILPLGRRHVECTGYVGHGVDSQDDPSLRAVRDVCLSMRQEP